MGRAVTNTSFDCHLPKCFLNVAIFPFPSGAYVERNTLKGNFMIIYGGIAWDFNRGTSAPKAGALPLGDAPSIRPYIKKL